MPSLLNLAQRQRWRVNDRVESMGLTSDDVLLSMQYDRIIDCSQLGGARAYNLHFAPLPRYRGSLTSALTVRHGEPESAVTLHELVAGVDAGAVIGALPFPVPTFFTTFDLYLAYHRHGFELFRGHALSLLRGTAVAVPQDDSKATMFKRDAIDFADAALERFDLPADQVRNWCRSLIFPPRQCPTFRGRSITACYTVDFLDVRPTPGTVVHDSGGLALVACKDGLLALEFEASEATPPP
jgi:methionyl-tRNA formyltransferase